MNKGIGRQMLNPYFELFFNILNKDRDHDWLEASESGMAIDIFDLLAIICRFSSMKELLVQLKAIV